MSIEDELQERPSVTEGDRALDLFTDRYSFTRLLAERINTDPPEKTILFFHGAGGNGKSLLLKYLRQHLCKRLTGEQWQQFKELSDEALSNQLVGLPPTGYLPVPSALLDFEATPSSRRRDRDPFYGLVRIREELAASVKGTPYRLKFPLHTYGCFLYLHKTNRLTEAQSLFPFEEAELLAEFASLFKEVPGPSVVIALFGLIDKYSGAQLTHYQRRFRLDEAEVQRLQRMDAEPDLINELPRLLAQDLNVAMAKPDAPQRVVLFFDTHEAFYGRERTFAVNFFRDSWLRRLLRKLDYDKGIMVVVAGRDRPRWPEADEYETGTKIPADSIHIKSVDNLATVDAWTYLEKVGISDAALGESLLRYASVAPGEVHPLHLGLCADVVLEARDHGTALTPGDFSEVPEFQEKSRRLIRQLLTYVDTGLEYAIHALSACRAFDFEIFQLLGERLHFNTEMPTFQRLVSFSFIRQVASYGENGYRIHDLLRRLDDAPQVRQAHEVLAEHYQAQREIEAIYHINRLDWEQGVDLWIEQFKEALELSQYELCRALLYIRRTLTIETPFKQGLVSSYEGQYFQSLALYEAAQQEYVEAIATFDKVLEENPANVKVLTNRGAALKSVAEIQATQSQYEFAMKSYEKAIDTFDKALEYAPDYVFAHSNKGTALSRRAEMQTAQAQYVAALKSYRMAIIAFDEALRRAPDYIDAYNNRGLALHGLAVLCATQAQYEDALNSYEKAIVSFNETLKRSPDYIKAHNNKGLALHGLAVLLTTQAQYGVASENYGAAIVAFDHALGKAPNYISAHNNKGVALLSRAEVQAIQAQYRAAFEDYDAAIDAFAQVLRKAPDYIDALNNKGLALHSLANVQATQCQDGVAVENYGAAIETFNEALQLAPNDTKVLDNKGLTLCGYADVQAKQNYYKEALDSYKEAIATFNAAIQRAPDNISAYNNKGLALQGSADVQTKRNQYENAQDSYKEAIAAFDAALQRAPADLPALINKGNALQGQAVLQTIRAQYKDALSSYEKSIAAFGKAIGCAPHNISAHNNKGLALQGLAILQAKQSQYEVALENYGAAIAAFDTALKLAPDHIQILKNKGLALQGLVNLQASLQADDPEEN